MFFNHQMLINELLQNQKNTCVKGEFWDHWFLGLDASKDLVFISLRGINRHSELMNGFSLSVPQVLKDGPALYENLKQIFIDGLCLNFFTS